MSARLIIRDGRGERTVPLEGERFLIGRVPECQVIIEDGRLSRRHCELVRTEKGYKVVDLGSRNGTWVNRESVRERLLEHGDVIRIGDSTLIYEDPSARRIPGRLRDYHPGEGPGGAPAPAGEPAVSSGPREPQGADRPRATTRAVRRKSTERIPFDEAAEGGRLKRVEELRREREERSILRTVVLSVCVFFATIVVLVGINMLTRISPEEQAARRALREGRSLLQQAEEEPDPNRSVDLARRAIERLRSVPDQRSASARARDLEARARSFLEAKLREAHRDELEGLAALEQALKGVRTSRDIDALAARVQKFRETYSSPLPETELRLEAIEKGLDARRGTTDRADFEEGQGEVETLLRSHRYGDALIRVEKLLAQFESRFELWREAVRLRERVIGEAGLFMQKRLAEARDRLDRGDPERARKIYEETLEALGSGRVPGFSDNIQMVMKEMGR